jgi:methylmalonyl-CoA mutase N-terminal domain/subunit
MDELLDSGFFVSLAEKGAARLKEQFAQGEKTLIGVNRHPSPLSRPCAPYPIPAAVGRDFKALSPVFLDA